MTANAWTGRTISHMTLRHRKKPSGRMGTVRASGRVAAWEQQTTRFHTASGRLLEGSWHIRSLSFPAVPVVGWGLNKYSAVHVQSLDQTGCWYRPITLPAGSRKRAVISMLSAPTGWTISPPLATTASSEAETLV